MTRIPRRQAGLTLVELMISMVIGMVIVLAVITAYISASRAARVAEATGRMNEDAQAALTIMTQQLRMAGANPAQPNRNTTTLHNILPDPLSIRGCDSTFELQATTTTAALRAPPGPARRRFPSLTKRTSTTPFPPAGGCPPTAWAMHCLT